MIRQTIGKMFTPPPMPDSAFPNVGRIIPGARETARVAWEAMFYTTLTQGITIGAVATLAIIMGIVLRFNIRNAIRGAVVDAFPH